MHALNLHFKWELFFCIFLFSILSYIPLLKLNFIIIIVNNNNNNKSRINLYKNDSTQGIVYFKSVCTVNTDSSNYLLTKLTNRHYLKVYGIRLQPN